MPIIHQLSAHVANLIAAGEVVERPASVVKELLENAVDAGASAITVEIQNGGMTFLRVTDDGCGMAPDDAQTAFLRHATSKIRSADDLAAIGTLGFRGEALAAIASVSRIDLLTRTESAHAGVSLHLEAGKVTEQEEAGCPTGTTIIVRDLFFNTPARMKFMKSDSAEGAAVFTVVQRQALSHPEVAFRFIKDGQEQLSTPGDGQLESAVYCVFGRQFALELLPVKSSWEKLSLSGFAAKPGSTRGNRNFQTFFVNGRPVKSKLLSAALEQAYQNQIMTGRFPGCVLHLSLPEHTVDVNVHPAKTEVKFLREREVFDAVHYGVLGALNRAPGKPEMKLSTPAAAAPQQVKPAGQETPAVQTRTSLPDLPTQKKPTATARPAPQNQSFFRTMDAAEYRSFAAQMEQLPKVTPDPKVVERVFSVAQPVTVPATATAPMAPPPVKTEPVKAAVSQPTPPPPAPAPAPEPVQAELPLPTISFRVVGEVLNTYLVVEQGDEVYFIDKHAAHERILFEKLTSQTQDIMSQMLLSPIAAKLTNEEAAAVLENQAMLRAFGFEAEEFGGGTVLIRQIPADMDEDQAECTLQELADKLLQGRTADPASLRNHLLHTIACKAAIKGGWHTEPRERDALVREVLSREDIKFCPHGRPICIRLTRKELEKQFGRT